MLKILGKASSINVRKVLWTCAELNLACEREDWGSGFRSTAEPAFLALNPNAQVPVLVDTGVPEGQATPLVLWESNTICRYLASRYADGDDADAGLLPRTAAARARVEQWMDWQASDLNNAWRYAFMGLVRASAAHADAAAIAASAASWNRHMLVLERQLAHTGAFAAGPAFSLADVVLGLAANRWRMTPIARPAAPAIDAWLERLAVRPGYRDFGANGLP